MSIHVGGIEITDSQVFEEMQYQDEAQDAKQACFLAAQSLVVRQLLLNTAFKQKVVADIKAESLSGLTPEDEEKMISALIDQSVTVPEADNNIFKHYYESNLPKFTDKRIDKVLPFEQVVSQIKEYLAAQSLMNGIKEYIQVLAANTKIKGFDFKDPEALAVDMGRMNEA